MYRLLKSQRIRKSSDFEKFRQNGIKSIYGGFFILKILTKETHDSCYYSTLPRIAIITSKKIGNAVIRNRIRRTIREIFRTQKNIFNKNCDYLFIALRGIGNKNNKEIYSKIAETAKNVETI